MTMLIAGDIPGYAPLGSPRFIPERSIAGRYHRDPTDSEPAACIRVGCYEPTVDEDGRYCAKHVR